MKELKRQIAQIIRNLITKVDKIEFNGVVNDTAYSMVFYVTVDGIRSQCFDLVDDNQLDEDDLMECFARIAEIIRNSEDYKHNVPFKISFNKTV